MGLRCCWHGCSEQWPLFMLRVSAPTTAVCRGSPRGVSHSNPDAGNTVKRQPTSSSSSCSDQGSDSSPLPADRPRSYQGANTLSAWRERPRPWPQAWQAKRPFRVVAHATGLLLATAPVVARPGGRHGAPPDDRRPEPAWRESVIFCTRRPRIGRRDVGGYVNALLSRGNTSREGLFPHRVPLDMLLLAATMVVVVPGERRGTSGGRMAVVDVLRRLLQSASIAQLPPEVMRYLAWAASRSLPMQRVEATGPRGFVPR